MSSRIVLVDDTPKRPHRVILYWLFTATILMGVLLATAILTWWLLDRDAAAPTVLFVWRDAGETYALLPVMHAIQSSTSCPMTVRALVTGFGTAPDSVLEEAGVVGLSSLDVSAPWLGNRSGTLGPEQVARVFQATLSSPARSMVVTGLVSAVQLQLAAAARSDGTYVAGFDDGFASWSNSTWAARSLSDRSADSLWLVSQSSADAARQLASPAEDVEAVGSPALESWVATAASYGHTALAAVRSGIIGVPPDELLIVYFGGYGDEYYAAVQVFAAGVARLQQATTALGRP
jgi:hypothetical protein